MYYTEPIRREPNHRGRPRLVSVLAGLPGALHHGFDGDGTPNGATVRLWEFKSALPTPLPDDVKKLTTFSFDKAIVDREAAKPAPPLPPPPTEAQVEYAAANQAGKIDMIARRLGLTV